LSAKYDEDHNYKFSRSHNAIPVIGYNPPNEYLSVTPLNHRGYDQNGWPYAPCGIVTRPNALTPAVIEQVSAAMCIHQKTQRSFPMLLDKLSWFMVSPSTFLSRSLNGSFQRSSGAPTGIGNLRPYGLAPEKTNSAAKDYRCLLTKPKVRGLKRASILGQMAFIAVLLKLIVRFIVRLTVAFRK